MAKRRDKKGKAAKAENVVAVKTVKVSKGDFLGTLSMVVLGLMIMDVLFELGLFAIYGKPLLEAIFYPT